MVKLGVYLLETAKRPNTLKWSRAMLHPSAILAESLAAHLAETFARAFDNRAPRHAEVIAVSARLVMERLALSDALYHDAAHTALVTLVAQDILRGRRLRFEVSPDIWLHVTLASLAHDIGYVRGACRADTKDRFVVDGDGTMIALPRGSSDAALAPYHVERSKIAVRERFAEHDIVDAERLAQAIELTRFPVPDDDDHRATDTEAALVRAADLIGQLGDPLYLRKLNALYHEFEEIGMNAKLGYANQADLADCYPGFFWTKVEPYLGEAIRALEMTIEGRVWLGHLYAHVCVIEHGRFPSGQVAKQP